MARKKASFSSFLFGFFFGIIALIGAVAYGGYWAYNNFTINTFESLTGQQVPYIGEDSELRTLALKDIIGRAQAIPGMTFGEFKDTYGLQAPQQVSFLFDALEDVVIGNTSGYVQALLTKLRIGNVLGSPYNDFDTYPAGYDAPEGADPLLWKVRDYTISGDDGISNLANDLTVGDITDIFGVTLPEFLPLDPSTPLSGLGDAITGIEISAILDRPPESDTSLSASIIRSILDMTKEDEETHEQRAYYISEVSELFSRVPDEILVTDIITPPAPTDNTPTAIILRKVLYKYVDPDTNLPRDDNDKYKLSEVGGVFSTIGDDIYIYEIIGEASIDADPVTQTIIEELRGMTYEGNPCTINQLDYVLEQLPSKIYLIDIITPPAPTDNTPTAIILRKVLYKYVDPDTNLPRDDNDKYKLSEIGDILSDIGEIIYIKDIITMPDNPDPITENIINEIREMTYEGNPCTINQIGYVLGELDMDSILEGVTVQDLIDDPGDDTIAARLLQKIYQDNVELNNLQVGIIGVIDELKVIDIFTEDDVVPIEEAGSTKANIFQLIGWDTKLTEIGTKGMRNLMSAPLTEWQDAGFIDEEIELEDPIDGMNVLELIEYAIDLKQQLDSYIWGGG